MQYVYIKNRTLYRTYVIYTCTTRTHTHTDMSQITFLPIEKCILIAANMRKKNEIVLAYIANCVQLTSTLLENKTKLQNIRHFHSRKLV